MSISRHINFRSFVTTRELSEDDSVFRSFYRLNKSTYSLKITASLLISPFSPSFVDIQIQINTCSPTYGYAGNQASCSSHAATQAQLCLFVDKSFVVLYVSSKRAHHDEYASTQRRLRGQRG
ncbi:hypothetical protein EVAR_23592_1 [Eumeta japonica]|uniref:Uncharacterized protein n=1 Tax=Eumeta variegata TaxID=151549 RepID=A0A4C1WZ02_EUMVA|nr:hypothetical protein EVAR_23592_1 [Eumeta japonica]